MDVRISEHVLCAGRGSRHSSSLVKRRRGGFKSEGNFEFALGMQHVLGIVMTDRLIGTISL